MILTLFLLVLGVRVELPVEARVRGAELTLGAIAQVSGDDAAAVERVRAVRLGYSPAPGYSRLIHVSRVVQEAAAQVPDVRLELAGAGAGTMNSGSSHRLPGNSRHRCTSVCPLTSTRTSAAAKGAASCSSAGKCCISKTVK